MAKPRTPTDHGPTNPDVKYERSDIEPGTILRYMLTFASVVFAAAAFVLFIVGPVLAWLEVTKKTDLPAVAAAPKGPEPGPRLEAIEDLEERDPQLLPPRAEESLAPQRRRLAAGGGGAMPIEAAMDGLVKALPKSTTPAPRLEKNVRLPSKAASGRVDTGGR